jgi:heat shock protein HtpX
MSGYLKTTILLAALTALVGWIGFMLGGQNGLLWALVVAGGMNVFAWFNSDKMVLSHYGARQVGEEDAPNLVHMIRRLTQNAALPMPKVYIIENDQPNAFATGRSRNMPQLRSPRA